MQNEALCLALVHIIWKAGSGLSCVICLVQTIKNYIGDTDDYNIDGVTEKVNTVLPHPFNVSLIFFFSMVLDHVDRL